jgi:hypothetical protein
MSETTKDQIIMQLIEILESQRADIEKKSKIIADLESAKVGINFRPVALSQLRIPENQSSKSWATNNYGYSEKTQELVNKAIDFAIIEGKKELRFR